MYGLDLFSGIGGFTKALEGYAQPVAYCENDRYAQAVLLSRMATGDLPLAPIWDDITTLRGTYIPGVDIIYGGFPCQDISVAGRGEGLDGKRSGLFFEIARLVSEIRPAFVFLENVSAITVRGAERVVGEFCKLRYDCRWGLLSASDVGANHRRERWWLLAHSVSTEQRGQQRETEVKENIMADSKSERPRKAGRLRHGQSAQRITRSGETMENPIIIRCDETGKRKSNRSGKEVGNPSSEGLPNWAGGTMGQPSPLTEFERPSGREIERDFRGMVNGVQNRVDRLRALGNAVVPLQARTAFERLIGIK